MPISFKMFVHRFWGHCNYIIILYGVLINWLIPPGAQEVRFANHSIPLQRNPGYTVVCTKHRRNGIISI
jgi:hypothetical protein